MMSEYSGIQKPKLRYVHEFEIDQLDAMSNCLAVHGFAVIKNVLNEKTVVSGDIKKGASCTLF